MNTCYNAVDRHVKSGHGQQLALIYDSPVTDTIKKYTYQDLQDQVKIAWYFSVMSARLYPCSLDNLVMICKLVVLT